VFHSGGYTQATFDRTNFSFFGAPIGQFIDKQTYTGFFLGAGR